MPSLRKIRKRTFFTEPGTATATSLGWTQQRSHGPGNTIKYKGATKLAWWFYSCNTQAVIIVADHFVLPGISYHFTHHLVYPAKPHLTTVELVCLQADTCARIKNPRLQGNLGQQWAVSLPQCLLCIISVFLMLPAVDRSCKSKHLQLMTGVTPLLYWLACFAWDYFLYCVLTLLIAATIILVDTSHVYTSPPDLGRLNAKVVEGFLSMAFFIKLKFKFSGDTNTFRITVYYYCFLGVLIFILLLYGISGIFYAYFLTNFGLSASKIVGNYMVFSICFGE